ncbi:lipoate--protein ligase family protein [Paenibacillus sp. 1001270B_150601_E10]|uniref:lipoate--protein ligase family protein n=1 Tax=Paenibacillus sp. 1001270B_150601_E10 TaxID=2787079 RepID=UPI00189C5BBD|nr:biotin/lipoate A/B protein ligase family protein [Paenibacillus sp. 1001270B_150601_E10]
MMPAEYLTSAEDVEASLHELLLLDRTQEISAQDVRYAFALDELLCKETGAGGPAICHIWRHPRAFVMGLRDSRLPSAKQAKDWLEAQGYATAVRNSGGAAVPLDLGVINISLILPKPAKGDLHFHQDFERMVHLIRLALQETGYKVATGEVEGAYCPGDFDLSINGKKFCGIAQRRQSHAYIVQAFVIIEGSGQTSAQFVHDFYAIASQQDSSKAAALTASSSEAEPEAMQESRISYPQVTSDSTASLQELIGLGESPVGTFIEAIKRVVRERQTEAGMISASARLKLPTNEEIVNMMGTLRTRYAIEES